MADGAIIVGGTRGLGLAPTKRLATMRDVAGAALFLLDNSSINGVNLNFDNGGVLT